MRDWCNSKAPEEFLFFSHHVFSFYFLNNDHGNGTVDKLLIVYRVALPCTKE